MRSFLLILVILGTISIKAQNKVAVLDVGVFGKQNYLPVEGGSYLVVPDTITPLSQLIARLEGDWDFIFTGKAYFIGYTQDMFSIAARGDTALVSLLKLIEQTNNEHAQLGVLYTIHLIGINRTIKGRFHEEFVNKRARLAMYECLKYTDLHPHIASLLIRDPWYSDVPAVIDNIDTRRGDSWPLTNLLRVHGIEGYPLFQKYPDHYNLINLSFNPERSNFKLADIDRFETEMGRIVDSLYSGGFDSTVNERFEERIKVLQDSIAAHYIPLDTYKCQREFFDSLKVFQTIIVEPRLYEKDHKFSFDRNMYRDSKTGLLKINVGNVMSHMTRVDYTSYGSALQFSFVNNTLTLYSPQAAAELVTNWWYAKPDGFRARYNFQSPVRVKKN